jgi:hypothetical protein
MSCREFDLTIGKLPPVFNNSSVSSLRELTEDFARFKASRFNWQRENFCLLRARDPVCQIAWTNEHILSPNVVRLMLPIIGAQKRQTKEGQGGKCYLSPLFTGRRDDPLRAAL